MRKFLLLFLFLFGTAFAENDCANEVAVESPLWVKEGVVYSLYLRNFTPNGDFHGATEKLEHLQKLGVNIVWLLPIHPIGKEKRKGTIGSPYSIKDYYAINPAYGNKTDFKQFVKRAHELGLKVILDIVANHTSWDNGLINRADFYKRDASNKIIPPIADWHDVAALDYNQEKVRTYMTDVMKYWLKEYDLDGFRLDAAEMVPVDFWEEARSELHTIKPDIFLLGESDHPEALVDAFDADYAWRFESAVEEIMINGAPATDTLKTALAYEQENYPKGSLHLRFIDNHDKKRALIRYGEKGSLAAAALVFTFNGIPLIYNGMELGDTSESMAPALFEKVPIFWKSQLIRPEFFNFYQKLIALRQDHSALQDGETVWVENSDQNRIVTFLRKNDEENLFVAINLSNQPFKGEVSLAEIEEAVDITPNQPESQFSFPELTLKPWEFRIYQLEN